MQLTAEDIQKRVISLVAEHVGLNEDEITMDSSFDEDLGCDSLDDIELVMSAEEAFGIEIPDEDVETFQRVKDAVSYLEARLRG